MAKVSKIKNILKSNYLPHVLVFASIAILFVLVRMKGIEQHYQFNEITRKIDEVTFQNKSLKAKKAEVLSINNIRKIAKKYGLKEPSQKQIIVVP